MFNLSQKIRSGLFQIAQLWDVDAIAVFDRSGNDLRTGLKKSAQYLWNDEHPCSQLLRPALRSPLEGPLALS